MLRSLMLVLIVPAVSGAWEPVTPENPRNGMVSLTRVTDVMHIRNRGGENATNGFYIAFADADLGAACRLMGGFNEDEEIPARRRAGTYNERWAFAQTVMEGTALFARAHNVLVRVKLLYFNNNNSEGCQVVWLQTCFDPNNCQPQEN